MVILLITGVTSCGNRNSKKNGAVDMHTFDIALDWEGTYAGLLPAADCPGLYRMVALDSARFEMMDKYLERDGIYITKGDLKWGVDSLFIDGIGYAVGEGMLINGRDTLLQINRLLRLPDRYKQVRMIENCKGGDQAVMERYLENGKNNVSFKFKGMTYNLAPNDAVTQVQEYTDGKYWLQLEILDPAPEPVTTPIFFDGRQQHEFTIVSPTSYLYLSMSSPAYDVTYFNGDDGSSVMLLGDVWSRCLLLPQTEAWAKGAEYGDGANTWRANNVKATLTKSDTSKVYYKKIVK